MKTKIYINKEFVIENIFPKVFDEFFPEKISIYLLLKLLSEVLVPMKFTG